MRRFGSWVTCAIAITTAIIIAHFLGKLFVYKTFELNMMNSFYELDRNIVDVLCVGSSHATTSCDTEILWNEYGIPTYCLSGPSQPAGYSYYYLKEAFKYQSPRVVLLEASTLCNTDLDYEYMYAVSTSSMRLGITRIEMADNLIPDDNRRNLYMNIPYYHTRWKDLSRDDYRYSNNQKLRETHGFYPWWNYSECSGPLTVWETNYIVEPDELTLDYTEKICQLCQNNRTELVVYVAPHSFGEEGYGQINYWRSFFEDKGIPFIDGVQLANEIGFDSEMDSCHGHVSYYGANKISRYIGKFLIDNGYVYSRSNDKRYLQWDEDSQHYCNEYFKDYDLINHAFAFDEYMKAVSGIEDTFLVVTYAGNSGENHEKDDMVDMVLKFCGCTADLSSIEPYIGIFKNNSFTYQEQEKESSIIGNIYDGLADVSITNSHIDGSNVIIDYCRYSSINEVDEKNVLKLYVYNTKWKRLLDVKFVNVITGEIYSSEQVVSLW